MMPISSISRSQTPSRNSNKKEVRFERRRSKSVNTIPESSGASSNEDSNSESVVSTSTDVLEEGKIPKPEGEPGRPGRVGTTWNAQSIGLQKITNVLRYVQKHFFPIFC